MKKSLTPILLLIITSGFYFSCGTSTQENQETEAPGDFSGLVNLNGTELYCKVIGKGEPIVILHGGPGLDHTYFLPHLETLAEHYQLIFYDQRACGQSSIEVDTSSITMDNFIEDLEAVRQHFNLKKINLMGHSFGGLIAMEYAIKYQEKMKSLMLISSVPPTAEMFQSASLFDASNVSKEDSTEFATVMTSEAMTNGELSAIEQLMKLSYKRLFFNRDYFDSMNLSITDRFVATSGLLQGLQADLIDFDLTDQLKKLTCPTLVVYGDQEAAYQVSDDILYATIPNAQNWVIQDCGHFAFIEKKTDFERIVRGFMASLQ